MNGVMTDGWISARPASLVTYGGSCLSSPKRPARMMFGSLERMVIPVKYQTCPTSSKTTSNIRFANIGYLLMMWVNLPIVHTIIPWVPSLALGVSRYGKEALKSSGW